MKESYTIEDIERLTGVSPADARRSAPGFHLTRKQVLVQYYLPPGLYAWIQQNMLEENPHPAERGGGWHWRQFTEAAILACLDLDWPHPTWWPNYIARGRGGSLLDTSKQHTWTPFVDAVPAARRNCPETVDPQAPADPARREYTRAGVDPRTEPQASGSVRFAWSGHQHEFCATLGRVAPPVAYSPRSHARKDSSFKLSASHVVHLCVTAHFNPRGVYAAHERLFQFWREYVAMRIGRSSTVRTPEEIWRSMVQRGIASSLDQRVPLGSAVVEHLPKEQQFAMGFWDPSILRRFILPEHVMPQL